MADEEVKIVFYCKECQKLIDNPVRVGKKYEYTCPECKRDRVSFGTEAAVCDFFHIKKKKV
jgi:hypothetical protein